MRVCMETQVQVVGPPVQAAFYHPKWLTRMLMLG